MIRYEYHFLERKMRVINFFSASSLRVSFCVLIAGLSFTACSGAGSNPPAAISKINLQSGSTHPLVNNTKLSQVVNGQVLADFDCVSNGTCNPNCSPGVDDCTNYPWDPTGGNGGGGYQQVLPYEHGGGGGGQTPTAVVKNGSVDPGTLKNLLVVCNGSNTEQVVATVNVPAPYSQVTMCTSVVCTPVNVPGPGSQIVSLTLPVSSAGYYFSQGFHDPRTGADVPGQGSGSVPGC